MLASVAACEKEIFMNVKLQEIFMLYFMSRVFQECKTLHFFSWLPQIWHSDYCFSCFMFKYLLFGLCHFFSIHCRHLAASIWFLLKGDR